MFWKDKKFTRNMIMLAIPVGLQNLISAVLNIFDQIMVGLLPAGIADKCLSAVVVVNQVVLVYMIVLFATSNAVNVFIAQYTEPEHKSLIPHRAGVALSIGVVSGVIATLICVFFSPTIIGLFDVNVSYRDYAIEFLSVVSFSFIPMAISNTIAFVMRATKKLRGIVIVQLVAVCCNILMNWVFMFGIEGFIPAYGFIGAAYGTIVARSIEAIAMVAITVINKYPIIAKPSVMFKWDGAFNKKFLLIFIPILLNEISWSVSTSVFVAIYDKQPNSEVVMAAYNIMSTVDRLVNVFIMGVGSAACVIMGNKLAENKLEGTKRYAKYCFQFGVVAGLGVGAIMMVLAFITPAMFVNASSEAQAMATNMMLLYGATAVLRSMCFMTIVGILRSGGDTTFCLIAESLVIWVLTIPAVYVAGIVWQWNIYLLLGLTMVGELAKITITGLRLRGDKWIKQLH